MDDKARLDGLDRDIAATDRQPWHAPVIDVVPLRAAEAQAGNGADGNSNSGTDAC